MIITIDNRTFVCYTVIPFGQSVLKCYFISLPNIIIQLSRVKNGYVADLRKMFF